MVLKATDVILLIAHCVRRQKLMTSEVMVKMADDGRRRSSMIRCRNTVINGPPKPSHNGGRLIRPETRLGESHTGYPAA